MAKRWKNNLAICSAGTASYYKQLGLIEENVDITDEETDINILFEMALQRLVFMPFGYLVSFFLLAEPSQDVFLLYPIQCDQIGRFLKFRDKLFINKISPNIWLFKNLTF